MPFDKKKYPPDWEDIRIRIQERAKNCCEFCKIQNRSIVLRGSWHSHDDVYQDMDGNIFDGKTSEPLGADYVGEVDNQHKNKLIEIVCTVAHLDHDPENWEVKDDRLAFLCQRCHLNYDRPRKMAERREKKYKNSLFPI